MEMENEKKNRMKKAKIYFFFLAIAPASCSHVYLLLTEYNFKLVSELVFTFGRFSSLRVSLFLHSLQMYNYNTI